MGQHLPCIVTARLAAPVISDTPIHLDAILTEAIGRRLGLLRPDAMRSDGPSVYRRIALPLSSIEHDGCEVWCASADVAEIRAPHQHRWNRRRDAVDEEEMQRPFTPGAGPDRNMMLARDGYSSLNIRWYCVGHKREIRKALEMVQAIGAKRAQGCGAVTAWTVEHGGTATDWLVSPAGLCRRQVPPGWLEGCRMTIGSWRSPYFIDAHQERVSRVGSQAALASWLAALVTT